MTTRRPYTHRRRQLKYQVPNIEFARNELFVKACELAGIPPTKRQASRWRNRKGRAYRKRHEALSILNQERKAS